MTNATEKYKIIEKFEIKLLHFQRLNFLDTHKAINAMNLKARQRKESIIAAYYYVDRSKFR